MKSLVLYDSLFGNTKAIADSLAQVIGGQALLVSKAKQTDVTSVNLLIVGSPTHGGRPTPKLQEFLNRLPDQSLKAVRVAVFDTRFLEHKQILPLRLLMRIIGYAAPKLAASLKAKGGLLAVAPEGFIVTGKQGPLAPGELARAADWASAVTHA